MGALFPSFLTLTSSYPTPFMLSQHKLKIKIKMKFCLARGLFRKRTGRVRFLLRSTTLLTPEVPYEAHFEGLEAALRTHASKSPGSSKKNRKCASGEASQALPHGTRFQAWNRGGGGALRATLLSTSRKKQILQSLQENNPRTIVYILKLVKREVEPIQ